MTINLGNNVIIIMNDFYSAILIDGQEYGFVRKVSI